MNDFCDVVDEVPEVLQSGAAVPTGVMLVGIGAPAATVWTPAGFCHQETPFLTQYKAVGAYTLPYGVRIAGTFQSVPGPVIAANQIYTAVPPSLGRPFFAGQSQVNVVEPGTMYGDRLNQIDFKFSKLLNLGQGRLDLNVELYNAFNSDAILTQQNAYGATWQNALTVIQPRLSISNSQFPNSQNSLGVGELVDRSYAAFPAFALFHGALTTSLGVA
jgi:hypothetical protein